jgi:hypothetical protein
MDKLYELLRESVLIQAIMALTCLGVMVYMAVQEVAAPDVFNDAFWLILGFYFGGKTTVQAGQIVKDVVAKLQAAQTPHG